MRRFKRWAAAVATMALLAGQAQAQSVHHGFDAGDEGWTVFDGGDLQWQVSGGNPGGYLRITDVTGGDFLAVAPATMLGDRSAWLGGTLSFDARNVNGVAPSWADFGRITLSGGDQAILSLDMVADDQPPADGQWHRYSVQLTEAVWGASLGAVLADLRGLSIKAEFHNGVSEVVGLDNISVSVVPEPAGWAMLAGGALLLAATRRRKG